MFREPTIVQQDPHLTCRPCWLSLLLCSSTLPDRSHEGPGPLPFGTAGSTLSVPVEMAAPVAWLSIAKAAAMSASSTAAASVGKATVDASVARITEHAMAAQHSQGFGHVQGENLVSWYSKNKNCAEAVPHICVDLRAVSDDSSSGRLLPWLV